MLTFYNDNDNDNDARTRAPFTNMVYFNPGMDK